MLTDQDKKALHQAAQAQVEEVCARLLQTHLQEGKAVEELEALLRRPANQDRPVQQALLSIRQATYEQTGLLSEAPYFTQCDLLFPDESLPRTYYFSKFSAPDEQIFSWVSPIASIRYEPIGALKYRLPDGTVRSATLIRKNQFMIVKRKILFLSSEASEYERTLVYQDYFSSRKSTFALTDIVAQMEKAQDAVIRAPAQGPLLLSGPAGSGKTTLALHRLAYLAQSPETAEQYSAASMLVLVQDASSRDYFTELLPALGIHHVVIETFSQWALSILPALGTLEVRDTHTAVREEQEWYEYEKRQALNVALPVLSAKASVWTYLDAFYRTQLSSTALRLWTMQKTDHVLDRFDITLLLLAWKARHGGLVRERRMMVRGARGVLSEKIRQEQLRYSTIVLDEIQNYLPQQISLVRSCIDPNTRALLYVGDLAQQTKIGTIRAWTEVGARFLDSQRVQLQTVYRNSRQILEYIQRQGYTVSIPARANTSEEVMESTHRTRAEARQVAAEWVTRTPEDGRLVGVLAPDEETLKELRAYPMQHPNVRLLTFQQAQGVEFSDVVVVLPASWLAIPIRQDAPLAWLAEQRRIRADLLYVAYTRAMSRLRVIRTEER